MSDTDLCFMPAIELAAAIRTKQVSPVEVLDAVLARIDRLNPMLNAFCLLTTDTARQAAQAAEQAVMRGGALGALHGVPVSIKDLVITKGVRTMRGSKLYEHDVPAEDAPVVERLKAAGAIILGKTTTPEFGFKGVTDSPVTGLSRNPWHLERTPGGSSGGAGAAVATGMGPLAVGTDGGGSIRIPSSFCGIYGLKPHVGRVPVYPASVTGDLSHVGPMTRTVQDAALMLSVIAGADDRDRFSLQTSHPDYLQTVEEDIRGLRVAWSPDLGFAIVDPQVRHITAQAANAFSELGCHVEETHPDFDDPGELFQHFFYVNIGAMLQDYPGYEGQIDPQLLANINEVAGLSGQSYASSILRRSAIFDKVRRLFATYDLLLCPTVAVPPFGLGLEGPTEIAGRTVDRRAWLALTPLFNLTGQPAATVPCGFTSDGLPIGLQIVGRRFDEATVLRASAAFEAIRPWAQKRPPTG
ncbi:MAG TPA: amidase [Candidatus Tectomicrobia bacterium]|nr:amidase [Candidatus Tectomicrobia bacterium]